VDQHPGSPRQHPGTGAERNDQHRADDGYRSLAEAMPQLVWVASGDGVVTYYNQRASQYSGITSGPGGWSWRPVVHPDDTERTSEAWSKAVAMRTDYECEHRVRMADGSYRWHISRALPEPSGPDGEITWFGTATDIHAQKEVEAALRESETRLRTVFEAIDQGYCVCELVLDDDGRPVDYRFLETNRLFEQVSGLRDASGRTALELVPDLEPHWLETYARVALGGESLRFEETSEAMGRRFDVFVMAVSPPGRFVIVFSDITARDAAERALRESENRFRNMADNAPVMIWVTEADGSCSYLSQDWYDFTGQTPETGLGTGWLEVTHPDDKFRAEGIFLEATRTRSPCSLDYRLRRHDGVYRWVLDAASPRFGPEDEFLGFIGSVIDITERKEAEVFLLQRQEEEHRVAVRLQQSLLPREPVTDGAFTISTRYVAAADALEVGGDWYESFRLDDGRIGLAVGDVVGHNIEAAAAMGQMRAGLLALSTRTEHAGGLLRDLDVFAHQHGITEFATACCAFIDPVSGIVDYASAGHPPVLVVPPSGDGIWLDEGRSAPLGIGWRHERPDATFVMERGALLFAFTDGLVERRQQPIDDGMERLRVLVEANRELSPDALCQRVLDEMADGTGYEDDTVVLCFRLGP
jgi:PAS domain S-box-containing protein